MNQELIYQDILIFFVIYFLYKITVFVYKITHRNISANTNVRSVPFVYKITHRSLLDRYNSERKLQKISWEDFERLCAEIFANDGWQVKCNETKGPDGGVDVWMQKIGLFSTKKAIVQCKRYAKTYVGVKIVREMYGLMYEYEVDEVYIVTTSFFTKECYNFVKDKNIILIDKPKLLELLHPQ